MNISNCSLKDECEYVKELKNKISDMQESYETEAEAKFYDYVGKHESKLEKENQLLKKRLENCYCNRTDCSGRIKDSKVYDSLEQKYDKQVDNWNKLKEYIKETKLKETEKEFGTRYAKTFTQVEVVCNMITNKMQEMEGSDRNE